MTANIIYVEATSPKVPECPFEDCHIPVEGTSMNKFGVKIGGCSHIVSSDYKDGVTRIGYVEDSQ